MIGKTVAQYQIQEQLGSGGMGVVYKAVDTKLGRTVALKFLPVSFHSDEKAKERFMQEARAASSLDDPHICTIHDIAETDDGKLFIVMAFYDGQTLKYLLEEHPPSIAEACGMVRQVAKGLTAAHEAGIVHRDIKPANIMVTEKGLVKVLDFGVAKLSGLSDLTQAGSTMGTASYMSPEQVRAETITAQSDIWSMGVILYELLAGKRPFSGGYEAAITYSILNEAPDALPDRVPAELKEIVTRCLAKSPSDRFVSARELADALTPFADPTLVQTVERPAVQAAASRGVGTGVPGADPERAVRQAAIKFSIFATVGLLAVYMAMLAFGLPDWVLPLGVVLMLAGLPIVLYAASLERKRAVLNSGERARLSGLSAWLTTRRAFQGGLLALGALGFMAGGYLGLRAAGVGPFATLISSGALTAQDVILVAHFDNSTDDPSLSTTVTEALRIDLSQSGAFRLMDRSAIQDGLIRMQVNPDTVLTSSLARVLAEREGVKAVIEGDINRAGAGYILNTRIVSSSDGRQLAAFRENANSDADVLGAIDRASARLREEIGESITSIRSSQPLEQVTTSNTEALRLYTESERLADTGAFPQARDMMQRVVRMDPDFAMAYRKLAVLNANAGGPQDSTRAWISRGYALRENLPMRERLLTEAYYYSIVEDDDDKEAAAYEEVLRRYPYDETALNNLSIIYNDDSRHAEAEELIRRALTVRDGSTFRSNLVRALAGQQRFDEVRTELEAYDRAFPGLTRVALEQVYLAFAEDDIEQAYAWADSMEDRAVSTGDQWQHARFMDNLLLAQGRIREASAYRAQSDAFERSNWRTLPAAEAAVRDLGIRVRGHWDTAIMTGNTRELDAAIDSLMTLDARASWDRANVFRLFPAAGALAMTGRYERALTVLDTMQQRADQVGEEMFPFGDMLRALSDGMLGNRPAAQAVEDIRAAEKKLGCQDCGGAFRAMLHEKAGDLEAAAASLEAYTSGQNYLALEFDEGQTALALFRLGSVNEELGRLDEAISAYERMADRWSQADPELQSQVAEARRRIQTLLDRKAREGS
ncbi:MAG: protein kinase [Rhodothermales bacterium]